MPIAPKTRGLHVLAVAFALAVFVPRPAAAQSYAEEVWTQLQNFYRQENPSGYALRNYVLGKLDDDETDRWTFPLNAGTTYLVWAACDRDCSDVDLRVLDPGDREIAKDDGASDIPNVRFTPRSSGTFTIEIKMYTCTTNPCYWGFGLFQR